MIAKGEENKRKVFRNMGKVTPSGATVSADRENPQKGQAFVREYIFVWRDSLREFEVYT